jgi:hypothetical protein
MAVIISNLSLMYENNSTTNAILVILLVIVVGFIVWFAMGRGTADDNEVLPNVEVNLPGGTGGSGTNTQ